MGQPTFEARYQSSVSNGWASVSSFKRRYCFLIHREIKQTRGSETSQYPEERTSTETPVVVASEPGPGQCLIKTNANRKESRAEEGDSPVAVKLDQDSSR